MVSKRDRRSSLSQASPAKPRKKSKDPSQSQTEKAQTQGLRRPRLSSFRYPCQTARGPIPPEGANSNADSLLGDERLHRRRGASIPLQSAGRP